MKVVLSIWKSRQGVELLNKQVLPLLPPLAFFFSSRRRHTRSLRDWSSDVCSSDLSARRSTSTSRTHAARLLASTSAFSSARLGSYFERRRPADGRATSTTPAFRADSGRGCGPRVLGAQRRSEPGRAARLRDQPPLRYSSRRARDDPTALPGRCLHDALRGRARGRRGGRSHDLDPGLVALLA